MKKVRWTLISVPATRPIVIVQLMRQAPPLRPDRALPKIGGAEAPGSADGAQPQPEPATEVELGAAGADRHRGRYRLHPVETQRVPLGPARHRAPENDL